MPVRIIEDFYEWQTVVEAPVVEKFFPGIFDVKTCLYVGIRPEDWGDCEHPNGLEQALRRIHAKVSGVDGMEIWPGYVKRLRKKPPLWLTYLWEMDICDIRTRLAIQPVRYDLVIWWHGPQHAVSEKAGLLGLANCEYLCLGQVLLGMPWGVSQNTLSAGLEGEPDNPYEAHGWEVTPEKLDELGYDVVALNCRRPEEKDRTACGHLIGVKSVR